MKAFLKHIHSPDVFELSEFIPKSSSNFSLLLQLIVAPLDSDGEESFDVLLCTPQWLMDNYKSSDIIIGRHHLIVFEYNYDNIYNTLHAIVQETVGESWEEIALKINRIGKWEFEDYHDIKK